MSTRSQAAAHARLNLDDVRPVISCGTIPAKAVVGEAVPVTALAWREGHDEIGATLISWPQKNPTRRRETRMNQDPDIVDRVHGLVVPDEEGLWSFRIDVWSDSITTWRTAVSKKLAAGQDAEELANDLAHGVDLFSRAGQAEIARQLADATLSLHDRTSKALTAEVPALRDLLVTGEEYDIHVERPKALYSSWYELFPRSTGGWNAEGKPVHGTFATTAQALQRVKDMGFDTVYFPPIHPIGQAHRKGKNSTLVAEPDDVGSPWAIADHTATHPELGTMSDFRTLVRRAATIGLEVALDLALQASPDHRWAKEHPQFFTVLADGTIAYAENPPKKYQDIYPINFDNAPDELYAELYRVVMTWVDAGVTTYRVDNPHTKPAAFWSWLIAKVHRTHPEVIFLAEAFTRPARLFGLAKRGFTQSYTYFTWKTTKAELTEFAEEHVRQADICRPNLFVNTPDILHETLQTGGRAMFAIRATLASTISPLWGMYSGFELYEHTAVKPGSEEYLDSEKYQLRPRDFDNSDSLAPYIGQLNRIRRENPALQQLRTLRFHDTDNDHIIAYSKTEPVSGNVVLVVVNLDPRNAQEATVFVDTAAVGRPAGESYPVRDMVTGACYEWGGRNFVRLEPMRDVAHIFLLPPADDSLREQTAWRRVDDYRA